MGRIRALAKDEASPDLQATFEEISATFGRVPTLFGVTAHFPSLLKLNWERYKALMLAGSLSRKVKEVIALLISKDNGCQYCIKAHTHALKVIGVPDSELDVIYNEQIERAELSTKEIHLITLARTANLAPKSISDSVFQRLQEAGAQEHEIVEALAVMELFVGFNKFLDVLSIEPDF
jgi:uncharacterized peroxidase-related enzyme